MVAMIPNHKLSLFPLRLTHVHDAHCSMKHYLQNVRRLGKNDRSNSIIDGGPKSFKMTMTPSKTCKKYSKALKWPSWFHL